MRSRSLSRHPPLNSFSFKLSSYLQEREKDESEAETHSQVSVKWECGGVGGGTYGVCGCGCGRWAEVVRSVIRLSNSPILSSFSPMSRSAKKPIPQLITPPPSNIYSLSTPYLLPLLSSHSHSPSPFLHWLTSPQQLFPISTPYSPNITGRNCRILGPHLTPQYIPYQSHSIT